jgi:hypothetical protein
MPFSVVVEAPATEQQVALVFTASVCAQLQQQSCLNDSITSMHEWCSTELML